MQAADARKVIVKHPDARSSILGPGPESVPRSTVRPQRAVKPIPDVGGLPHIRDNVFPPQPQLMMLPSTGEGYQLDDGCAPPLSSAFLGSRRLVWCQLQRVGGVTGQALPAHTVFSKPWRR